MGWFPCECCSPCCKSYEDCPCTCVSRYPCSTTLTVSGNHPATLKFPIQYIRNPSTFPPQVDFCGLEGCAEVSRNDSNGHTQLRSWSEQDKFWDDASATIKVCCGDLDCLGCGPLANAGMITAKAVKTSSRCYRSDLRYHSLEVKVWSDRKLIYGQQVCGLSVRARLTFKRYITVQDHTCIYFYARREIYSSSCPGSVQIPSDDYISCGWCEINNEKVSSFSAPNVANAPFPSPPPNCGPLTDEQWDSPDPNIFPPWDGSPYNFLYDNDRQIEKFCIVREKFIPNSTDIGCNGPFTVTLTPEDTISDEEPNFPAPNTWVCCGETQQISQWYGYQYCQATHTDPEVCSEYRCPINPTPVVACPSFDGFGVFYGRNEDCEGEFGSTWIVSLSYLISSTPSNQQYCNSSFDPILGGSITINPCNFSCAISRNRGYTLNYDIVDQTVLFGEAFDSWQLTLECPD